VETIRLEIHPSVAWLKLSLRKTSPRYSVVLVIKKVAVAHLVPLVVLVAVPAAVAVSLIYPMVAILSLAIISGISLQGV
jgi:hypothetical protein